MSCHFECWCPNAGDAEAGVSSAGVQANAGGAFSPLLSVSIGDSAHSLHSPLDSGSYASADAARVGGGLYKHLLQAACTLATDPAPKVARIGKAALKVADVELAPASQSPICSLARSPTHSLTHSLTHALTRSLTHPPTHSLTHSLTSPLLESSSK